MNLEEVAKRAGVSTATVSRVLNNIDVVKNSTRARVMKAVAELNYHPNLHARTLAGGKSATIGMIASNLENPFFFDIFRALERQAHLNGRDVVVLNTDYDPERLRRGLRLMIGRRVAGVAVIVSEMETSAIDELIRSRIPAVFYDVGSPRRNISTIRVNYRRSMERLVEYLHDLGHERFAYIGHHAALAPTGEREQAFVETVSRYAGAQWRTITDQDGPVGGQMAARALFESDFPPTAIICVNDFMALGVLREVRDRGLQVPGDVSVTGFDNIRLSQFCDPPLTTAHIPRDRIGELVFETLVTEMPKGKTAAREIQIEAELVLRGSTGPARSRAGVPTHAVSK